MYELNTFFPGTTLHAVIDWANEHGVDIVQIIERDSGYIDLIYLKGAVDISSKDG